MRIVLKQFSDIALLRQNSKRRTTPKGPVEEAGFTLLEMMIVLVIIAVIAALITVNVMGRPDEARGDHYQIQHHQHQRER
jgi:general secretion pathway protein G